MSEQPPLDENREPEPGLFKRYPKLSILIIALVAYGLLIAMCAVVFVLLIRG